MATPYQGKQLSDPAGCKMECKEEKPLSRLSLRAVSKRINQRQVLHQVDLTLLAGEILVLLGPNGAGKTTLLRSVCGQVSIDTGEILVDGRNWQSKAARRQLGFVPQSLALYPSFSVRENLEVFGGLMRVPRASLQQRIDIALSWSELQDRQHDLVENLSGGMQRWLNILVSTLHNPKILLLDEPSTGVDLSGRERLCQRLQHMKTTGLTMLLTTHDLDIAERLADRVALMVDGAIDAAGSLQDLVRKTFGDGKELIVSLLTPANAELEVLLQDSGLKPASTITWRGITTWNLTQIAAFSKRIEDRGNTVASIKVGEPGLAGLFFQRTGQVLE